MIVLFTGPSLPPSEVPERPDLKVLPPVAQGDVYRAARERPWGIGLIDGFFERVPAVWHKEILWAMSEGVHVFGAASMGALRAAELADFGMVGVGRIFEQYRGGELDADDEVAVAHAGAEHGYRRASEPLVDIRATLRAALDAGVCSAADVEELIACARAQLYADRTWPSLIEAARAAGKDHEMLSDLERWLPAGRVNQKRADALAMIDEMVRRRAEHPGKMCVRYTFEHTSTWDQALFRMREAQDEADRAPGEGALLEELRLLGDEALYALAIKGALLRALAEETARRAGLRVGRDLLLRTAAAFRRERGLHDEAATMAWLAEQRLDGEGFVGLMTRESRLRWLEAVSEPELRAHLVDQLRAMGHHGRLDAQARDKRAVLERAHLETPALDGSGLDDVEALWRWYFQDVLGRPVPEDLPAYAERFGLADPGELFHAALRERWYRLLR